MFSPYIKCTAAALHIKAINTFERNNLFLFWKTYATRTEILCVMCSLFYPFMIQFIRHSERGVLRLELLNGLCTIETKFITVVRFVRSPSKWCVGPMRIFFMLSMTVRVVITGLWKGYCWACSACSNHSVLKVWCVLSNYGNLL